MRTVLVIDDNPAVGTSLDLLFGLREIRTLTAQSPQDGMAVLAREPIDLVVQDMNFSSDTTSGEEGVALFRAIRERHPDLPIVLLTAWTHLETAVELVKAGASDYQAKPWDDHKLVATVETCSSWRKRRRKSRASATNVGAGARRSTHSSTCAAWCSHRPRRTAWSNSPARSREPTSRC
jgi:DNA-binding NtrC family response regulator